MQVDRERPPAVAALIMKGGCFLPAWFAFACLDSIFSFAYNFLGCWVENEQLITLIRLATTSTGTSYWRQEGFGWFPMFKQGCLCSPSPHRLTSAQRPGRRSEPSVSRLACPWLTPRGVPWLTTGHP